jgi:hypothetical protein
MWPHTCRRITCSTLRGRKHKACKWYSRIFLPRNKSHHLSDLRRTYTRSAVVFLSPLKAILELFYCNISTESNDAQSERKHFPGDYDLLGHRLKQRLVQFRKAVAIIFSAQQPSQSARMSFRRAPTEQGIIWRHVWLRLLPDLFHPCLTSFPRCKP